MCVCFCQQCYLGNNNRDCVMARFRFSQKWTLFTQRRPRTKSRLKFFILTYYMFFFFLAIRFCNRCHGVHTFVINLSLLSLAPHTPPPFFYLLFLYTSMQYTRTTIITCKFTHSHTTKYFTTHSSVLCHYST